MKRVILILLIGCGWHTLAWASCAERQVHFQVLGSGGPELNDGRASTSYLVWVSGKARLFIDAGSGASLNFGKSGADFADLEALLLTHLHVDHSADLPAFVKGSFFTSRDKDLQIFGPAGNALMPTTSDYVNRLLSGAGAFAYLSEYVDQEQRADYHLSTTDVSIKSGGVSTYKLNGAFSVSALSVYHGPVASLAWRVDVGQCRIVVSGDMSGKTQGFGEFAKHADLLVMHNAIPMNAGRIAKNLHMTAEEIGKFSQQANAKRVVISHRMNRTNDRKEETTKAIRIHYDGKLEFADDLDVFDLN